MLIGFHLKVADAADDNVVGGGYGRIAGRRDDNTTIVRIGRFFPDAEQNAVRAVIGRGEGYKTAVQGLFFGFETAACGDECQCAYHQPIK